MFAGLVSVALGVYLFVTWTAASTYSKGIAIGVDPFFDGASLAGFAGAIHGLPKMQSAAS